MSGQDQGGRNVTLNASMLPILTKVPSLYGPLQELVFVPRTTSNASAAFNNYVIIVLTLNLDLLKITRRPIAK